MVSEIYEKSKNKINFFLVCHLQPSLLYSLIQQKFLYATEILVLQVFLPLITSHAMVYQNI